jgi:hypothetical protein
MHVRTRPRRPPALPQRQRLFAVRLPALPRPPAMEEKMSTMDCSYCGAKLDHTEFIEHMKQEHSDKWPELKAAINRILEKAERM